MRKMKLKQRGKESILRSLRGLKLLVTGFCLIILWSSFCYSQIPYSQIPELNNIREILKKEGKKRIDFPDQIWSRPYIWASKIAGEKTLSIVDEDTIVFLTVRDTKGDFEKGDNLESLAICQEFMRLTIYTGPFRRNVTDKFLSSDEARRLVIRFLNLWFGKFKADKL